MTKGGVVKDTSKVNLSRKLKRLLTSSKLDASSFEKVKTFEPYLKDEATGAIYDRLLKLVTKKARQLKVTLSPEFAKKPVVIVPDLVETATSAGTFQVL